MPLTNAIQKAATLIEAMGYVRRFAGKIVVIKLGGSFLGDPSFEQQVLGDVAFLHTVGMRPIVVHGGGKEVSAAMKDAGLQARFVQGLRYTDEATLAIAEDVLCNRIASRYGTMLRELGVPAMPLHSLSSCAVFARRKTTAADGTPVDLGFVGDIESVNGDLLTALCEARTVPVIAPIARDRTGLRLNVNADTIAGHVAAAVRAEKLVMMSDTHGIRSEPDKPETRISELNEADVARLIADSTITAGMQPKTQACLHALRDGVGRAHILDGQIPHALLLEIFTDAGVGTMLRL